MNTIDETLLGEVKEKLDRVKSINPFQLIFYGSKSRGDDNDLSDYNFYLLASPTDQLRASFIQEISEALDFIDTSSAVSLVAGDMDSLSFRMRIFEPTAVHLCELGQSAYGKGQIEILRKEWESMKEVANEPKYQAIDKEKKANYASCQGCYRVIKEEGVSWDVKDRYISHLTIECTSGWSKGKMHHPYLRKDGVYENYGMLETRTFSTLDKYATAHCDR